MFNYSIYMEKRMRTLILRRAKITFRLFFVGKVWYVPQRKTARQLDIAGSLVGEMLNQLVVVMELSTAILVE